jgi:hypothetical protein
MVLRFPSPVRRQGRIEQAILRRFLCAYLQRDVPLNVESGRDSDDPPALP